MSSKIGLVILDIDGVMTNGSKVYGLDGIPFAKSYCDKDFTAIKQLKASGIQVIFLSGDERVNKAMAKNRNIKFYSARGKDKGEFLLYFENTYKVPREEMLYLGDDLFDINILKKVGHPFCPSDASVEVKEVCHKNILPAKGGENVIMALVEHLTYLKIMERPTLKQVEELDKLEDF